MNTAEHMQELDQIDDLIRHVLANGRPRGDRTDTGTLSTFGYDKPLKFTNVGRVFPAINKKRLAWKPMLAELLWFLSGSTNLKDLKHLQFGDRNSDSRTIWDANYENEGLALGHKDGELGAVYGQHMAQQLQVVMDKIAEYPEDRRLVMSNWQHDFLESMTLPPCHGIHTQFYVADGKLYLNTSMR